MNGVVSYILSKSYCDKSILGISGVLAGKNCKIASSSKTDGVTTIVFEWTADDGTTRTTQIQVADGETPEITITPITGGHRVTFTTDGTPQTVDIMDGVSVVSAEIKSNNHLELTLSDGTKIDCGEIISAKELNDLTDVNIGTLSDGDVLAYDEASGKWINREMHYEIAVEDLTDVNINKATLVDGDIIKWDATAQKWVKGQIPTIESLDDIGDVDLTTPTDGQILVYDETDDKWKNTDNTIVADIDDLGDVDIDTTTLENGQILKYDSVSHKWVNGSASATSTKIEDLADVSVDSATLEDGMVLVWDATNQVWVNQQGGVVIDELGDITDVDLQNLVNGDVLTWDNYNSKWVNIGLDNAPTQYSTNMINSGAVYTSENAINQKIGDLTQLDTTDKSSLVNAVNEINGEYGDAIGDLTQLTTTDKSSLVGAINEVDANADTVDTKVGALSNLTTTDKTSIVLAINEVDGAVKSLRYVKQLNNLGNAEDLSNSIVQYTGTTGTYIKGYFYYSEPSVEQGQVVYNWVQMNVQPTNNDYDNLINKPQIGGVELVGDKSLDNLGVNGKFQYTTMPNADNSNVGRIVEYIGNTTADYTNAMFYKCVYDATDAVYKWVVADVSGNTALANRIATLETNQGDMSALSIAGVTDLVSAINVLAVRGIKSITYSEPYLTITLMDDSTFQFDITVILNATDLGDLGNVIDTTIANTNVLQYDSSILKYKPYDVVGAMSTLLQDAKDYTDTEIGKINLDDAFLCDSKPSCSYDSGSDKWIVVYYQASQVHTSTDISARYYYKDTNDDPYCTSWFLVESGGTTTAVELTYLLSSVNLDDYINRNTDVVSTYMPDMADKTKIPDIASIDALYTIVSTALGLKVNTSDIVDALNSDATDVPLSAHQGKVLNLKFDEKQDVIQYNVLPIASETLYNANAIYQYIGSDSGAFKNGRFYKVVSDGEVTPTYSWQEVKFSADYDATIIQDSTNAPQGGAVYTALQDKQNVTLSTPIVVEGTQGTTVEGVLGLLNNSKSPIFFYSTMPQNPTVGMIVLYTGTTTQNFTTGCFYRYDEVPSTSPQEYVWTNLTPKVTTDSAMSISSTNPIQNQAITGGLQALQNGVIVVYPDEASLLSNVDYSAGSIVSIGTLGYCVSERSWHKVTAIDSSTLAVTWSSYDPHLAGEVTGGDGIEIDAQDNNSINVKVDDTTIFVDSTSNEVYGLGHDTDDFDIDTTNKVVSLDVTQRAFTGTTAEWEDLTDVQKAKYLIVNLTDDAGQGITVVNVIQNNNMNVPTSNAVFNFAVPKTLTTGIVLGGTTYTDTVQLLTAMASLLNDTAYLHVEQP